MTARSDRDLTPESIIKKVSDASGSKYSGGVPPAAAGPPPPILPKPVFTPTKSSGAGKDFNPLAASRVRTNVPRDTDVDEDGWGQDAPPVTRTQLEKVQSSYQPTKVNIREISSQSPEASRFRESPNDNNASGDSHVVKGGYQPVGKVDIAALRRQAQEKPDDRPVAVKGSYEPVGKVDIAAIRARAQQPYVAAAPSSASMSPGGFPSPNTSRDQEQGEKSLPDRAAPSSTSERLTSLPKPKVASRFGVGASSFAGTKAPTPTAFGLDSKPTTPAPPIGVGRTFADQGGKTPAQLWAEKKARERGLSGASDSPSSITLESPAPVASQSSGEWKSGYGGKSWAPVQINRTGQSASSLDQQRTGQEENAAADEAVPSSPNTGIGARRDRFQDAAHTGATNVGSPATSSPPPLDTSSKPNAGQGMPMPGLPVKSHQLQSQDQDVTRLPTPPAQPPRSPTPPTPPAMDSGSPIRVAMPIGRGKSEAEVEDAHEEQFSPPQSMPTRSLAHVVPHEDDLTEEPVGHVPARGAGEATAPASFGQLAAGSPQAGAQDIKRALVQYDYEKAEDNELELREGEYVTNIEMVDEDWWMGENSRGESGLFPSNYVDLVGTDLAANGDDGSSHQAKLDSKAESQLEPESTYNESTEPQNGMTATALYDYEAAEGNELSFPENAKITGVVCIVLPRSSRPLISVL